MFPDESEYYYPIQELNRSDALVALIFLDSTDLRYLEKVEDPWFSATTAAAVDESWYLPNGTQLFQADQPMTVIGCTSQVFYCNPKLSESQRCVNIFGPGTYRERFAAIWPGPNDLIAFLGYFASDNVMIATPDSFYDTQGLPSLLARFTLDGGLQLDALSRDKWKQEMEYTCQGSLVSFQSSLAQASQKGVWFLNRTLCDEATDPGTCEKLCRSQKVRSSEHYSFSVLGVSIILFLGLFLMLVATFLEFIAAGITGLCNRDQRRKPSYSRLEWDNNSFLQLQRLAHEAIGLGTWSRSRTGVPVTAPGELLGVLDVTDSDHPVLKHSGVDEELQDMDTRSTNQIEYSAEVTADHALDTRMYVTS
ncbi:hypothetical protein N0V90_002378 [Kalmusia sp. IMI 367209]|nr:hypothetical protein N0V90_002378 [Kalmusia sp. IMI 367209]